MNYIATFYSVSDAEIIPTGKTELYVQPTLDQAIEAALYTHRLHEGAARSSIVKGVITCPKCGQASITKAKG